MELGISERKFDHINNSNQLFYQTTEQSTNGHMILAHPKQRFIESIFKLILKTKFVPDV